MIEFVLGLIVLFAVGTCAVKDACKEDNSGMQYKFCKTVFEKEKLDGQKGLK